MSLPWTTIKLSIAFGFVAGYGRPVHMSIPSSRRYSSRTHEVLDSRGAKSDLRWESRSGDEDLTSPVRALSAILLASSSPTSYARRTAMQQGVAAAAGLAVLPPTPAFADLVLEEASRMGGQLEPMVAPKFEWKIFRPSSWTMFDGDDGGYDAKFRDLVEQDTTVQISTAPVKTATSVSALGTLDEVANKFATKRNAKVVSKSQRDAEGFPVYVFELQGDEYHELIALCISGESKKLYRVEAIAQNKNWKTHAELFNNMILSFVPKGS
mmetsp:Transcript_72813/g.115233  ORF Transcript_72813/g.115233 Transcript_72813/m.115233 type:complete len:268 (+) Transcript_72813:56-859(+)